ncbi:ribonuclease-like protein T2 [Amylocarpus encephaloides]|uniref:Ribonuclease T2-like n=1 Tax=Amylocarpus encephaloides TaxID=45428 RepID=A0A9P8C9Q2_9HELO|nr:ribonuclease-like protein T2 [Amylocarpus encephaloides]
MILVLPGVFAGTSKVCTNPLTSCGSTTSSDTCCYNSPGGQFALTQFWDTNPSTGPSDSWTVHGLWPDHCDGTYDQNCDSKRAYTNITQILKAFGKTSLLSYMNTYWKDYTGNDESFWEHEWGKHGTCISTLKPACYTGYTPTQEVPDYFQKAVDLFKTRNTYQALINAGITPSTTKTYTSAQIQAALKAAFGVTAIIQCSSGALDEVWYSYYVQGSVATGTFIATTPVGQSSSCASTGIKWLPKSGSPAPTTTGGSPTPTGGSGTISGSGYLNAVTSGSGKGCLISAGTWYTTGTCATFTARVSGSSITLTSSKGTCGIVSGVFTCGSGVAASVFTDKSGTLAYSGSTTFYATAVPGGSTQLPVYTASKAVSVSFAWTNV